MGCTGSRESLEDQILLMRLERMEVQMMKEMELKKLADNHGVAIKKGFVPDYIDPVFAKENNIYDDDEYMLNNIPIGDKVKVRDYDEGKRSERPKKGKSKSSKDVRAKTDYSTKKKKKDKSKKSKKE